MSFFIPKLYDVAYCVVQLSNFVDVSIQFLRWLMWQMTRLDDLRLFECYRVVILVGHVVILTCQITSQNFRLFYFYKKE